MNDENPIQHKWDRIYTNEAEQQWPPAEVLAQNKHLLPSEGTGVDIACGYGPNAVVLAERGIKTYAWDISPVAIRGLSQLAKQRGLDIVAEVRDIDGDMFLQNRFDVMVVAHYLDRRLMPQLRNAIRPGGLVFYQTFITDKVDQSGPRNTDFLLQPNELFHLFPGFLVRVYREEGTVGRTGEGFRNKALMVAQKPG